MASFFVECRPVFCPHCPVVERKGRSFGSPLEVYYENYSGCGVDLATCKECGRNYEISYEVKVRSITDISGK